MVKTGSGNRNYCYMKLYFILDKTDEPLTAFTEAGTQNDADRLHSNSR